MSRHGSGNPEPRSRRLMQDRRAFVDTYLLWALEDDDRLDD
jgi:hypothetical protein